MISEYQTKIQFVGRFWSVTSLVLEWDLFWFSNVNGIKNQTCKWPVSECLYFQTKKVTFTKCVENLGDFFKSLILAVTKIVNFEFSSMFVTTNNWKKQDWVKTSFQTKVLNLILH